MRSPEQRAAPPWPHRPVAATAAALRSVTHPRVPDCSVPADHSSPNEAAQLRRCSNADWGKLMQWHWQFSSSSLAWLCGRTSRLAGCPRHSQPLSTLDPDEHCQLTFVQQHGITLTANGPLTIRLWGQGGLPAGAAAAGAASAARPGSEPGWRAPCGLSMRFNIHLNSNWSPNQPTPGPPRGHGGAQERCRCAGLRALCPREWRHRGKSWAAVGDPLAGLAEDTRYLAAAVPSPGPSPPIHPAL